MLLAIDIGNTNISAGIFKGGVLKKTFDIPSKGYSKAKLLKKLKSHKKISATAICSVVPGLTAILKRDLEASTGRRPYIIGKDIIVPMKNCYLNPKQLGQDRLVNVYAAAHLYKTPLIVIDSGSAITFDAVSKDKKFLGGLIFPGFKASLKALKANTALLPLVKLAQPKALIGKDTGSCILNGVIFGIASLSSALAGRIKKLLGKNTSIIGTGGNIALLKKYSGIKINTDKQLTLRGINLIYENAI